MGRMKDLLIDIDDEELQVLLDNFQPKGEPTSEELQAELNEQQAHEVSLPSVSVKPEVKVYLLMKNGYPVRSYTDRALAFYECWICTKGEEYAESPDDYYVVEMMHDTSTYTGE
jgi:hypothetical protein